MAKSRRSRGKKALEKALSGRLKKARVRLVPLSRLVDTLPGVADPLLADNREALISRETWTELDTRRRNQAVGFVAATAPVGRHALCPPRMYSRTAKSGLLPDVPVPSIKAPKLFYRYKDKPLTALATGAAVPVGGALCFVPRLKTTPIEDLSVILNSRLFHFHWKYMFPDTSGKPHVPAEERLRKFNVPMLTKRVGGPFRELRDEILARSAANNQRLIEMDQMDVIAEAAGVPLAPLRMTEGIIREINVPKPLAAVANVKRRGPVVIFRRGSTIVTTTEEAATYLEMWLQPRFSELSGMTREQLDEYVKIPHTTAHVVVVLQNRVRIEAAFEREAAEISALQRIAESRLYDLYGLKEDERDFLSASYA